MTDVEIKPMENGTFIDYLTGIFTENGKDFSKMLCENKISCETERSIVFELTTPFGKRELEITLRDLND